MSSSQINNGKDTIAWVDPVSGTPPNLSPTYFTANFGPTSGLMVDSHGAGDGSTQDYDILAVSDFHIFSLFGHSLAE